MEDFLLVEKIREGAFGVIYKVINKETKQCVALKKIVTDKLQQDGIPSTTLREISFLKELNHPNIVKLVHVLAENSDICLIFEFLDMDLKRYMDGLGPCKFLDSTIVKSYLYQINSAILYCHSRMIIHRDLKPQNLLIDRTGIIKVADFALSRTFGMPRKRTTYDVVLFGYKAPELLLGTRKYSCLIDIWAMGCIFAEMISKKALFQGDTDIDQLFHMFRMLGTPLAEIWPGMAKLPNYKTAFLSSPAASLLDQVQNVNDDGIDLLRRMLWFDPCKRITAKEVSLHPYFRKLKLPLGLAESLVYVNNNQ